MKETGIIRRIDELGRVVIPKEIRKSMRINEGDPLEIFTEADRLFLKKFSPVGAIGGYLKEIAESVYAQTSMSVAICDTDAFLTVKGAKAKELDKKDVSRDLLRSLKTGKTHISDKGATDKIALTALDEKKYNVQLIMPIISQGDLFGGLVLLSDEAQIDSKIISLASFVTDFLARLV